MKEITVYLSLAVMGIGLILFWFRGYNDQRVSKLAEVGKIMFAAGLLSFLLGH
jgi:hypothetical protein